MLTKSISNETNQQFKQFSVLENMKRLRIQYENQMNNSISILKSKTHNSIGQLTVYRIRVVENRSYNVFFY